MSPAEALAAALAYVDTAREALAKHLDHPHPSALRASSLSQLEREGAAKPRKGEGDPPSSLDQDQHAAHGFAWIASSVAALEALHAWHGAAATPLDTLVRDLATAETLAQLVGGVAMGPGETARPADLGLTAAARTLAEAAASWLDRDWAPERRALADRLPAGERPTDTLGPDLDAIRDQFRRFTDARIIPHAHRWHLGDTLIPDETIAAMAQLGTFGVTIAEEHGGAALGKLAMCVVTEELSRGWIGAGSLGTRSEIAAELIAGAGTDAQRAHWLPQIANGSVLPTAVFTEPDVGSDLASLATRAVRGDDDVWHITGAKNWITHASRSDLMTLLARTSDAPGYAGLSMLLVPKPRGSDADPFPADGMSGSEIGVLGYRGMREYALSFDGMAAPADALLGGAEGQGFKQLMRTFESARIQTAARAVGVARRAHELGLAYALDRRQFGRALIAFPRVADKLAMGCVDIVLARELTYAAARAKDSGRRCDIEAGMAKLLAARTAWGMADASLQIHGGNGYALEYEISRVLVDARILSIFEGAAEIQAQVIARGLVGRRNQERSMIDRRHLLAAGVAVPLIGAARHAPSPFVRARGMQLRRNERRFAVAGTNMWYAAYAGADAAYGNIARLERELDRLQALGINNVRLLGGSEQSQLKGAVSPSIRGAGNDYDETLLRGLDRALAAIGRRGMTAVIYVTNFWEWSGGMAAHLAYVNGGRIVNMNDPAHPWPAFPDFTADFYANHQATALLRDYIRALVTRTNTVTGKRYADDPAIMAWELANEPRPAGSETVAERTYAPFQRWVRDTAAYIKSLDRHHLVTTGSEGLKGCLEREACVAETSGSPDIDYVTIHIWPLNWSWVDTADLAGTFEQGALKTREYIAQHVAIARRLGKPLVIEEFGFPRDGGYDPSASTTWRDRYYRVMLDEVAKGFRAGGPIAGANFWAWNGEGRAQHADHRFHPGDTAWLGDPSHEPQGWYGVFDTDRSTQAVIRDWTRSMLGRG